MKYTNPILSGFYPDPSICRVENDYYMVNSSFEYFPGIPIFHSTDLLNWEQIGHCINRDEQLKLMQGVSNCAGMYAPTIRYQNGIFYVICTNVAYGDNIAEVPNHGNFYVFSKDPFKEWSNPVWLDCEGIDPSLFFDEDGRVYYTGSHGGIYLCELDLEAGTRKSEPTYIWYGTGGCCPEGPHIYKRNGWYYLLISEGGTEYAHMITVARSQKIEGPFESYQKNPILSNRSLDTPIKATGHADIVEDQNGNWWTVCLGIRPISYPFRHNLGRETMLVPMYWNDMGWPVMGNQHKVEMEIETKNLPLEKGMDTKQIDISYYLDTFQGDELDFSWNFLYEKQETLYQIKKQENGIVLFGNEVGLSQANAKAWLGRRQKHHNCKVRTELTFTREQDKEEAGITIYMNEKHHYEVALIMIEGKSQIMLKRQIGSLWKLEKCIPYESNHVFFELEATKEQYEFRYSEDGKTYISLGRGETAYLTTEVGGVFTGNYIALYATGNGNSCKNGATFHQFEYSVTEIE